MARLWVHVSSGWLPNVCSAVAAKGTAMHHLRLLKRTRVDKPTSALDSWLAGRLSTCLNQTLL